MTANNNNKKRKEKKKHQICRKYVILKVVSALSCQTNSGSINYKICLCDVLEEKYECKY